MVGADEDERQAAVRYWKRAIQVAVDLDCRIMNSEFNGRPEAAAASEAQFWRSLEELLPVFEREGMQLRLEPHPDDFIEDGRAAVEMIRGIDNDLVSFLYCAPHTFHQGGDLEGIMRYAGPLLTHLHIADSFDHRGSSGLRYILNPPGTPARIHQHLDIGQGEVDWDLFFATLADVGFDGIATVCVFAWEERAADSCRHNLEQVRQLRRQARRPVGRCADDRAPGPASGWGAAPTPGASGSPTTRARRPGTGSWTSSPRPATGGWSWAPTGTCRPTRRGCATRSTGAGCGSPARPCSGRCTTRAAGSPTCATPTRWPSWSRPWAPATWCCSRPTRARTRRTSTRDRWRTLVERTAELGRILRDEHGLAAVFHPHADSYVGTQPQIERFLAETDPADVNLCLDTGHVAYYQGDNVELIRRYPDRIGYLHLKQADPAVLEQVKAEGLGFGEAVRRGVMCEPPKGEPDMEALLDAVDQHLDGELFAIVEQDLYPCDPDDPLPIATRTCTYLRTAGRWE